MKHRPIDQTHLFFALAFKELTTKQRKAVIALVSMQESVYLGMLKDVSPSRSYVAKSAKCSVSTFRDVLASMKGILFTHKKRRDLHSNKNKSNVYEINEYFFEFIQLLKINHFFNNWQHKSKEIILKLQEDDLYLCRKALEKPELSTMKLPTVLLSKLPTIRLLLSNSSVSRVRRQESQKVKEETHGRKGWDFMQSIPISYSQKERLTLMWSPQAIKGAVADYRSTQNGISNLGGYLWKCAERRQRQMMGF